MKTFCIDFEYRAENGRSLQIWCVAWVCLETGEEKTLWLDRDNTTTPFPKEFRMVAHYALAELSCFLELGWKLPNEVIDTLVEARTVRGQRAPALGGWSLLSVANSCGIRTMSSEHKNEMRDLAMGHIVPEDKRTELELYCLDDALAGLAVYKTLEPRIEQNEAILRGRFLKSLALIERRGIPSDRDLVVKLTEHHSAILEASWLKAKDSYPGVISETGKFSSRAWADWCESHNIRWPQLASGLPALDADTFKRAAEIHPVVRLMGNARKMRGQNRKFDFPLCSDNRLRCMLSPFSSDTGRNQPPSSKFIFGASSWLRSIVSCPEGKVLAYVDYTSQEVGLAAALSKDRALLSDYESGDPYIAFAIRAGAAPSGSTKKTHPNERASYKTAALAIQYGIGEVSLAGNLGIPLPAAKRLVREHQSAYPKYWQWRQTVVDEVNCGGTISTQFGWQRKAKQKDSANSVANFPVQAAGAEILRIAIIALEESGHSVVAPVHDAVLVEMEYEGWTEELAEVRRLMSKAAKAVTGGLSIPTDVELTFPGENFLDSRGQSFWEIVKPVIGRGPLMNPKFDAFRASESQM